VRHTKCLEKMAANGSAYQNANQSDEINVDHDVESFVHGLSDAGGLQIRIDGNYFELSCGEKSQFYWNMDAVFKTVAMEANLPVCLTN
jgi:hypothetical protein